MTNEIFKSKIDYAGAKLKFQMMDMVHTAIHDPDLFDRTYEFLKKALVLYEAEHPEFVIPPNAKEY